MNLMDVTRNILESEIEFYSVFSVDIHEVESI